MNRKKTEAVQEEMSPSRLIDARISELNDWRSRMLQRAREIILEADPDIAETVKWQKPSNNMRGVPVWERDGIICTGEIYKDKVKLTFARGAALDDSSGLFNAGLEGKVRRAIDLHEGADIDEKALKKLVRVAAVLNTTTRARSRK